MSLTLLLSSHEVCELMWVGGLVACPITVLYISTYGIETIASLSHKVGGLIMIHLLTLLLRLKVAM